MSILARLLCVSAAICVLAVRADAAVTYVWENSCDESQINNSGVGDGSTDSPATGHVLMRLFDADEAVNEGDERVYYELEWDGLESLLAKIHIHGPAMEGASNPGHVWDVFSDEAEIMAAGVDRLSDRYTHSDSLFDLMLASGGLTTGVPAEHLQFMIDERAYVNIHTATWPLGEIRCQLLLEDTITTDPQTKDQQKCTAALGKGFRKVGLAQGKQIAKCVKDGSKGKVTDLENCVLPGDGVDTAQAALDADFDKRCTGTDKNGANRLPDFGVSDALTAGDAATTAQADVIHDVFGDDLDASIDDGTDKSLAKCQAKMAKTTTKCESAYVKAFGKCVKNDLRGKVDLPIVDDFGFEHCLQVDRKGKIAKACGAGETGGLGKMLGKKCSDVDLTAALPGCDEAVPLDAATCIDTAVRCRTCLAVSDLHDTAPDCDLFDDGVENLSCAP
jgi:hypothetical protein